MEVPPDVTVNFGLFSEDAVDLAERCHKVPYTTLEDSMLTQEKGQVSLVVAAVEGSDVKTMRKPWRPKAFPSYGAFSLWHLRVTRKVMQQSPPEFLHYRLEGMLMFGSSVVERFARHSWEDVAMDVAATVYLWKESDLLMTRRLQPIFDTIRSLDGMQKLKLSQDPFTPRGEEEGYPEYDAALKCAAPCMGKGWKKEWCPSCHPTLPGAMKALVIRNQKRRG